MAPTLRDGDIVFTVKTKPAALRSGFIYVINHSDLGAIIKRLGARDKDRFRLIADNPTSTPSAIMGRVAPERITHRVVFAASKDNGIRRIKAK